MTLKQILKDFGYEKESEATWVYQSDVIALIKAWLNEQIEKGLYKDCASNMLQALEDEQSKKPISTVKNQSDQK